MSALAHLLTEISDISVKYLGNYLPKVKLFGVRFRTTLYLFKYMFSDLHFS